MWGARTSSRWKKGPKRAIVWIAAWVLCWACGGEDPGDAARISVGQTDLSALSQLAVYFGHHAVGENILSGMGDLMIKTPGWGPQIRVIRSAQEVNRGVFGHGPVGENLLPITKIEGFEKALDSGIGDRVDVAFFTFCPIDFDAATDVKALFAKYKTTMDALQVGYPWTTFVHVTVPLTTVESGFRVALKNLFGGVPWGEVENLQRGDFNDLLRKFYGKDRLFDLAGFESTRPDGTRVTRTVGTRAVPALFGRYTDDGRYLNSYGRRMIAAELVKFLAKEQPRRSPGGEPAPKGPAQPPGPPE